MEKNTILVGLDVHINTIDVTLADAGRDGEVLFYGSIVGDLDSLHKVIRKLQSTGAILRLVYEAGPCGYGIYPVVRLSSQSYSRHCHASNAAAPAGLVLGCVLVYARHGRDLMGCKSPVCKPCYCREDRNINTSRKQGRFREEPSGGSWSAKL